MSNLRISGQGLICSIAGMEVRLPFRTLAEKLGTKHSCLGQMLMPPGCRAAVPFEQSGMQGMALIWESSPMVRNLKWITEDSPSPYGRGTAYREVTLALPYVVVMAVFIQRPNGQWMGTAANEAFFRNERLRSLDDELFFPALLNVSRMPGHPNQIQPLAWICTQHLRVPREVQQSGDLSLIIDGYLGALIRHMYDSGFNRSSEEHEGASWFGVTAANIDHPSLKTVEAWEQASAKDPSFVLDVPWLPAKHTLRDVIFRRGRQPTQGGSAPIASRQQIEQFMMKHGKAVS